MPSTKELADSLSEEQRKSKRFQEEAKILRSLYEKLINKVKAEDPARYDQAVYHQVRAHLQGLIKQHQQGLKPIDKILKDITTQAIKDRHAELEAFFDTCVNKAVEEKLAAAKDELQEKLKERYEVELSRGLDDKFRDLVAKQAEARIIERSGEIEAVFAAKVNEQVLLNLQPAKEQLELAFQSSLQAKFDEELPALLEERVQGRVVELRAEIESGLQSQYDAKLSAQIAELLADRDDNESATSTKTMDSSTVEGLEATIADLSKQLRAKVTEAESAIANFDELQKQITEKDNALTAEQEKTKAVQHELDDKKTQEKEREDYIDDIEQKLKTADESVATLTTQLEAAEEQIKEAGRRKDEAEQKLLAERGNILAEQTATSLLTERRELTAKVTALETEITTLKAENAKLPEVTSDRDHLKAANQDMKDQLTKFRTEMPKFDLRPHAYDAPLGSTLSKNLEAELSSDTSSTRSESVSGDEEFAKEFAKEFEKEGEDKEDEKEKPEETKPNEGKADDGNIFTPEPVYIWGPVRIVETPMTIASHNPFRCWFGTELATLLIGTTLIFRLYHKIQQTFGQGTPQTPPQGPPPPENEGSQNVSEEGKNNGEGQEGQSNDEGEGSGDDQDVLPPPPSDEENGSGSVENQDNDSNASLAFPITVSTVLSSASWNPAFRPDSTADINSNTDTAAFDPMSFVPDLSDDELPDTRIPLPSGSAASTAIARALFMNTASASASAFGAAANTGASGSGQQKRRTIPRPEDLPDIPEDEKEKDDGRPRMKRGEDAAREAANVPLPASPNSQHPPSLHPHSFLPRPPKTFWEEAADQSRALLSRETLYTVLSLVVHVAFYYLALVLWQTWVAGNVWKLANESTRKATQHLLFAGRGGQGQSWWHWVVSEKWASGIDYMLFRGFGGELIAYRMPG